jgi:hypothetical protein
MRARFVAIALAGALAGCAASENPPTGAGGSANAGSGGSMNGGNGGSGTSGVGGMGGSGGAIATGGSGGNVAGTGGGGAGTGGAAPAGTGGRGGAGGIAGASGGGGSGGASTGGQGGRGGGAGGRGGGGGASGGSSGAGSGGSSGGGVSGACAGKTYKLCDDFESGTVGGFPTGWTGLNGYGADSMRGVGLATDQAHSGAMALKSSSMVPGEQRAQRSLASLGATATKHWGRIFYRVVSPSPKPASGAVIHVTLAALMGTTENRIVDTVEQSNGTHQWLFNIPDDSCCTSSAYSWSFDNAWHCAEWFVDVTAQSYRFFTDGAEVTQLAFTGRAGAKMSNYTALAVGAIFYQAPPSPFTIWFDDLAIDDNQIGCQ